MERPGATTMKGNPLTLIGPELQAGDHAPDFTVVDGTLSPVNLEKTGSHVRIISVVPSLDTPVCDLQTKRFNEEAAQLPGVDIITVSMDLPFAQKRWCGAFGVDRIKMLSDHRTGSFGESYGTLIKDLRTIESRILRAAGSPLVRGGLIIVAGIIAGNILGFFRVGLMAYLLGTHS